MEKLSKSARELKPDVDEARDRVDHIGIWQAGQRSEAEGLRAFHDLLEHVGWKPGAASLRRVTDKRTGDILWVCPEHYKIYDPGLPILPPSESS